MTATYPDRKATNLNRLHPNALRQRLAALLREAPYRPLGQAETARAAALKAEIARYEAKQPQAQPRSYALGDEAGIGIALGAFAGED